MEDSTPLVYFPRHSLSFLRSLYFCGFDQPGDEAASHTLSASPHTLTQDTAMMSHIAPFFYCLSPAPQWDSITGPNSPQTHTSACTASLSALIIYPKRVAFLSSSFFFRLKKDSLVSSSAKGPRARYASKAHRGNKHLIMLLVQAVGQCGSVGDISSIVSLHSHQLSSLLVTTGRQLVTWQVMR